MTEGEENRVMLETSSQLQPFGAIASRLAMPRYYQVARSDAVLLPWSQVAERLESAKNYWLATARPDGKPHVAPVWGAWLDNAFYFDGIYTARWARNLVINPAISVHLESGTEVVILDGRFEDTVPSPEVAARIVETYRWKYGPDLLPQAEKGMYRVRPRTIRAWSRFPDDATKWTFS